MRHDTPYLRHRRRTLEQAPTLGSGGPLFVILPPTWLLSVTFPLLSSLLFSSLSSL